MNKAYKLLEKLMATLAEERNRVSAEIKTGTLPAGATQDEIISVTTAAISEITKIRRIEFMLEDVKSLFQQ
jgi:hypothetical protein